MLKKPLITLCLLLLCSNFAFANKRSPFLIVDMIPHMAMQLKKNWDNEKLDLNETQKIELLKIRKDTIASVMPLKKLIAPLEKEVATKILSGSKPSELKSLVDKIASFKAEATQVHLTCVYRTQKVLNQKQLDVLKNL
jgi:hypothetical protein